MDIKYTDIEKANKALKPTDVKGKDYVEVNQRVKAFRMVYPMGYIITNILKHENGVVMMQAEAGYYREDGEKVILGTGLAFETQNGSFINKTSYIENCETSAVGRALGMAGFGIDASMASYEEVANAQLNQEAQNKPQKAQKQSKASQPSQPKEEPTEKPQSFKCDACGSTFTDAQMAQATIKKFGKCICPDCIAKKQAEAKAKKEAEAKKKAEEEALNADLPFPI